MSDTGPVRITSRDNPLLVRLRRLAHDAGAYRRQGAVWLDGEHLCTRRRSAAGARRRRWLPRAPGSSRRCARWPGHAGRLAIVPDALYAALSALPSPTGIGFEVPIGEPPAIDPRAATVVLDRVQDAGNVGSVLRSAAAFGITQVLALEGTATLWSPKVLRAGMGAHFALRLVESLDVESLEVLEVPLVATGSHAALALPEAPLPAVCGWVFGHEGQGVRAELLGAMPAGRADSTARRRRVAQRGGRGGRLPLRCRPSPGVGAAAAGGPQAPDR